VSLLDRTIVDVSKSIFRSSEARNGWGWPRGEWSVMYAGIVSFTSSAAVLV
jgi:hypothetical protein